jgi:hypothetical protein
VTVVFPFEPSFSLEELFEKIHESLKNFSVIEFSLVSPIVVDQYIFFPLDRGRADVVRMHQQLYSVIPNISFVHTFSFLPHITFARNGKNDPKKSDQILPDQILPDQILPDQILPDQILPDQILPDQILPDQILPDQILKEAGQLDLSHTGILRELVVERILEDEPGIVEKRFHL